MLVLSRKINERIIIGDNICITVVALKGNQVRIGIDAPPDVRVFRSELLTPGTDEAEESARTVRERVPVGTSAE